MEQGKNIILVMFDLVGWVMSGLNKGKGFGPGLVVLLMEMGCGLMFMDFGLSYIWTKLK